MKTIYMLLVLALFNSSAYSQLVLERYVLSGGGSSLSSGGMHLSHTIGEPVAIYLNASGTEASLGFQQGEVLETGVEEQQSELNVQLYPNPTSGALYIRLGDDTEAMEVSVLNAEGKTVTNHVKRSPGVNTVFVDLSNYPAGTYFVRLTNRRDGKEVLRKFVLQ